MDDFYNMSCDFTYGGATMLEPGNLVATNNKISQDKLDKIRPIDFILSWIKEHMIEFGATSVGYTDRILIVRAKTASGKSTVQPVEIYRTLNKIGSFSVLVSEPKIILARSNAIGICNPEYNPDMVLGSNVGYTSSLFKLKPSHSNSLIYVTIGILFNLVKFFPENMDQYKVIIVDEVHERGNLQLDLCFVYIKRFLKKHGSDPKCPLFIFTSATFDIHQYAKYFEVTSDNIIDIKGFTYDIKKHYLPNDSPNIYESTRDIVKNIHEKNRDANAPARGILIFLPGDAEIHELEHLLLSYNKSLISRNEECFIISILSGTTVEKDSLDIFIAVRSQRSELFVGDDGRYNKDSKRVAYRRIIISTSVAESGISLPDIYFVIDCGLDRHVETFPSYGVSGVITVPTTKSKILQRLGRVGRDYPGEFYAIYTENTFKNTQESFAPAVISDNIISDFLYMVEVNGTFDASLWDMIDVPPVDSVKRCMETLLLFGFIKNTPTLEVTKLGELSKGLIELNVYTFRSVMSAVVYEVSLLDIVSMFSAVSDRKDASSKYKIICDYFDISLTLYKFATFDDYIDAMLCFEIFLDKLSTDTVKNTMIWCDKYNLSFDKLMTLVKKRAIMLDELITRRINPMMHSNNRSIHILKHNKNSTFWKEHVRKLKQCIYDGFRLNLLSYDAQSDRYKTIHGIPVTLGFFIPTMDKKIYDTVKDNYGKKIQKSNYLVTSSLEIKNDRSQNYEYYIKASRVSVLDGWIGI